MRTYYDNAVYKSERRMKAALVIILIIAAALGIFAIAQSGYDPPASAGTAIVSESGARTAENEIIIDSGDSNTVAATIGKFDTPAMAIVDDCLVFTPGATYGSMYEFYILENGMTGTKKFTIKKPISENIIPLNKEFFDTYGYPVFPVAYYFKAVSLGEGLYENSSPSSILKIVGCNTFTVEDLKLSSSVLSFKRGTHPSIAFQIKISNGETEETKEIVWNTNDGSTVVYDLTNFNLLPGTYEVSVKSRQTTGTGQVITFCEPLILNVKTLAAPVIRLEDTKLKWDAVQGAGGYRIYYTDTYLDTTNTELDITTLSLSYGEYTFKVRAIGNTAPQSYSQMRLRNVSYVYSTLVAVNYNVNGDITTELVESGSTVKLPAVNIDGFTFGGWFYDTEFENAVTAADSVEMNMTLYAKLTEAVAANGEAPADTTLTFWQKVGAVFKTYWWAFLLGKAAILVLLILIFGSKPKKTKNVKSGGKK